MTRGRTPYQRRVDAERAKARPFTLPAGDVKIVGEERYADGSLRLLVLAAGDGSRVVLTGPSARSVRRAT